MSKKRIMILGAGRGQVELIKASKRLGYEAIVASIKGNYPGFEYADQISYVDITSKNDVLQSAKEYNIDAIATSCMDTAISTLGYVCDECNLAGLNSKSAEISGDKLLMKKAFIENDVNTAKYIKVNSENELEEVTKKLQLPLIVKAVDLQGSRGINIVNTKDSLLDAYKRTMAETSKDFCIIEEFIEGYEFGAQAFIYNGEVLYVLPAGDITYTGVTKVPVGHYMPLEFENDVLQQIEENVKKAINAIGLDNCAVNIDMIIRDGKIYIIELTGRVGANCLAELSSIYYGIDVYAMIAMTAMGEDVKKYFEENRKAPTACYARMLMSDKTGVLKSLENNNKPNPDIAEITFFVQEGDTVNKFTNSRDCIGQIIVKGKDIITCEKLIDEVIANLEIEIEIEE
ncbi:MAG: ATP-grasp domain-containing protein [Acutalibacteraceae bacterium]|nr:ATP-grasp domain-containing protein [Acutalibacteraceae bacterium]